MKIAIVLAGVIVVAVAALVAIQPDFLKPASLALVKKSDMFGFSPGMTFEETSKLVAQRRYLCRQGQGQDHGSYVIECDINGARVTVTSDEIDAQHPIRRVHAELPNPGPQDAAVKSISEQFKAQAIKDARDGWTWIVGRGLKLRFNGRALTLADEAGDASGAKEEAKR